MWNRFPCGLQQKHSFFFAERRQQRFWLTAGFHLHHGIGFYWSGIGIFRAEDEHLGRMVNILPSRFVAQLNILRLSVIGGRIKLRRIGKVNHLVPQLCRLDFTEFPPQKSAAFFQLPALQRQFLQLPFKTRVVIQLQKQLLKKQQLLKQLKKFLQNLWRRTSPPHLLLLPILRPLIPLHRKTRRYRRIAMDDWARATKTKGEHYEIYQAIVSGNAELAEELTTKHIVNAKKHMIEEMKFNTAIAAMMSLINDIYDAGTLTRDELGIFVRILCPFAPHICEEIWEMLGHKELCSLSAWPEYDEAKTVDDEITLPIQFNGKLKATVTISINEDESSVKEKVHEAIDSKLDGKNIGTAG